MDVNDILSQARDTLTVGRVFGEPIERDGVIVIPVAKVARVERRPDSAFARIVLHPQALVDGARHVMVLKPLLNQIPPRPAPEDPAPAGQRPVRK